MSFNFWLFSDLYCGFWWFSDLYCGFWWFSDLYCGFWLLIRLLFWNYFSRSEIVYVKNMSIDLENFFNDYNYNLISSYRTVSISPIFLLRFDFMHPVSYDNFCLKERSFYITTNLYEYIVPKIYFCYWDREVASKIDFRTSLFSNSLISSNFSFFFLVLWIRVNYD